MSVKRTIAIVGATENAGIDLTTQFSDTDYRLLLVSNDADQLAQLSKMITQKKPKAEIDTIECVKDGCWEADIIILAVPSHQEKEVAEMMKEVATQKIVISLSDDENEYGALGRLLPYSKLVKVGNILQSKEICISGNDQEANKEIVNIFQQAGYHPSITNNHY